MENIEIVPSTYYDSICKALSDAEHLLDILDAEIRTPISLAKTKKKHKELKALYMQTNSIVYTLTIAKLRHEN
jgi:hypothetical protein